MLWVLQTADQAVEILKIRHILLRNLCLLRRGHAHQKPTMGLRCNAFEQGLTLCGSFNMRIAEVHPRQLTLERTAQGLHVLIQIRAAMLELTIGSQPKIQIYPVTTTIEQIHKTHPLIRIEAGVHVSQLLAQVVVLFFVDFMNTHQAQRRRLGR